MVFPARQARAGWDLLIASRVRLSPQALLPFRYAVRTFLSSHSKRRLGVEQDKVAAGMNPAAKATRVVASRTPARS